jgi:two-component system phosphate regulon sensor histidine kinase PhoR
MPGNKTDKTLTANEKALTIMAHDIKTPLTAIVSILDVIKKGFVDDIDKIRDLAARASKQAGSLISMIDDILDYTLLADKSKVNREPVHLYEVLKSSTNSMKSYIDRKQINLTYSQDLCKENYVFGSRTFLIRAFNNILMNAIKYNKDQGSITIECLRNEEQNTVTIKFNDTGIGIPEDDLDKVFKIFERGKQARRNLDGSLGLGLALVKQIIDFHYGYITVNSVANIGTTVIVTLPFIKKERFCEKNEKI